MRRGSKKSSSSAAAASSGPTKAVSKEVERIDQFFYTYADNSSGMIECGVRRRWQRSGEGQVGRAVLTDRVRCRTDGRIGPRDQTAGWPAAVADTWDIDKRKCTRRGTRTGYATREEVWWFVLKTIGGGRVRATLLARRFGGLSSKPSAGEAYGLRYSRAVWWFCLKTIGGRFRGFGPQNPGGGPEADGRHVAASGRSLRSEATGEKAWWSSDQQIPRVD